MHSEFALAYCHTMCGNMVDIKSSAAEIRRGKKIDRRYEPQGKYIMACPIA